MTNKELMMSGLPFIGGDAELMEDKARARSISNKYNSTDDCDENCKVVRRDVLKQLLGKCGDTIFVKPPFRCDYGYNISVGENFFALRFFIPLTVSASTADIIKTTRIRIEITIKLITVIRLIP